MKSLNKSYAAIDAEAWPSEQLLMEYFLGSLPSDTCRLIESWMAADPKNAERLSDFAGGILAIAEAAQAWPGAVSPSPQTELGHAFSSRRLVGLLALAAAFFASLLSLRGFFNESPAERRIAMAWAEALPVSEADLPDWMLVPVGVDAVGAAISFDEVATVLSDPDESVESMGAFGLSSTGPPEWLIAAVLSMESNLLSGDGGEVKQ